MAIRSEIWEKLDPLLKKSRYREAIDMLEAEIPHCESADELCLAARKLAHLYRSGVKDPAKASSYGYIAGKTYVQAGRMAPAVAMLKWLREIPEAASKADELQSIISKTFSQAPDGSIPSDEHLPPPTPYRVLKGLVSFDASDADLARDQWASSVTTHKVGLFSSLRTEDTQHLLQSAVIRELGPGAVLFREGDSASAFYLIAEGEMELSSSLGFRRVFKEGDFFGEIALLAKLPRTATLKTQTGAKLLEFSEETLREAFAKSRTLEFQVFNFFEKRLFLNVAARTLLFEGFSASELEDIFEYMTPIHVPEGRVLVEEGAESDRFYFLIHGTCQVYKNGQELNRLGPGQFIGEAGLVRKRPRMARVKSLTECHLLECHELVFEEICQEFPKLRRTLQQVAEARDPETEITDKIAID